MVPFVSLPHERFIVIFPIDKEWIDKDKLSKFLN